VKTRVFWAFVKSFLGGGGGGGGGGWGGGGGGGGGLYRHGIDLKQDYYQICNRSHVEHYKLLANLPY